MGYCRPAMTHALNQPALILALAMLAGVFAQIIARHVNVPGIVVLLIVGVVLGPDVLDVIRPQAMGSSLQSIVGFAIAVILFEGGLNLRWRALASQQKPLRRLVSVGALITAAGASTSAHLILGWDWRRALLFGTLVIVTGPTVITPLLRRIHVRSSVETILEAEGIFIDAIGATVAVVALEVLLAPPNERFGVAVFGSLRRFAVGAVIGATTGGLFAVLLRFRRAIPEGLANVAALATAIATLEGSNALVPESGIVAVILAGMVVGNTRSHDIDDLREFKEQLTALLVATLFVLLSADVRIADVRALGLSGALTVTALIFIVRPATVFASTWGTELQTREKLFLAWLAPRGIVAAAVSALFADRLAEAGIEGGTSMRALVFLVIAVTVVVQGLSAGWIAAALGIQLARDDGFVILGADAMARLLGAALRTGGQEVVFIDTNADAAREAEEAGFKVVFGDGLDDRALMKARVGTRRGCIGATGNESVNYLFARKVRETARHVEAYVAIDRKTAGVTGIMVDQVRGRLLYAGARALAEWGALVAKKRVTRQTWRAATNEPVSGDAASLAGLPATAAIPLAFVRNGRASPVEPSYRMEKNDLLELAVALEQEGQLAEWLTTRAWSEEPPPA
jgi:NhaP-type Na+/H+ or K+/H+ antiporter